LVPTVNKHCGTLIVATHLAAYLEATKARYRLITEQARGRQARR